ncbi:ABC transporter substrate-binding protein, partial [Paenibacillus sp. 2TAB19]
MKIRKLMVLLCAFVLVLSACSGGSGNGSSTNNGSNQATNNGAGNTATAAPEGEEEVDAGSPEMDFDLGGKTIKVVSWWDMTIPEDNPDNIQ